MVRGWGLEFEEISCREEDEKRGFWGAVGLLLRRVEAGDRDSQRQTDRQRGREADRRGGRRTVEDLCFNVSSLNLLIRRKASIFFSLFFAVN